MRNPVDTYYAYVVQQMLAINAQVSVNGATIAQPMCGYVAARDWPMTPPIEGGLYLLFLNAVPTDDQSRAQKEYEYFCQWVWILIGQDIQADDTSQNRASRYASNMQIMENLRQAHYPGWTVEQRFQPTIIGGLPTGGVTGVPTKTQMPGPGSSVIQTSPIEIVRWTDLRFIPRQDNQKSGLIYGAAALELYARSDVLPAVA
jgi:hypothetical protein